VAFSRISARCRWRIVQTEPLRQVIGIEHFNPHSLRRLVMTRLFEPCFNTRGRAGNWTRVGLWAKKRQPEAQSPLVSFQLEFQVDLMNSVVQAEIQRRTMQPRAGTPTCPPRHAPRGTMKMVRHVSRRSTGGTELSTVPRLSEDQTRTG
jgi:hypothetical protein